MELDQNKFMNLVMERTNKKLNELQAQVIVLEAQLTLAVEENNKLKKDLEDKKLKNQ